MRGSSLSSAMQLSREFRYSTDMHPLHVNRIPPGWRIISESSEHQFWQNDRKVLAVMTTIEEHEGKLWHHCSISHPKRLPTYDELAYMRKHWMGTDLPAIMVFPDKEHYVNTHPTCLHLFVCLDLSGNGLPEFSKIDPLFGRQI